MLTRRTFVQGAGVLAAGAATGGIATAEPVKELGLFISSKIGTVSLGYIFADEPANIFGIRFHGDRPAFTTTLIELPLSTVKCALKNQGQIMSDKATIQRRAAGPLEVFVDIRAKDWDLAVAMLGQLELAPISIRQVYADLVVHRTKYR